MPASNNVTPLNAAARAYMERDEPVDAETQTEALAVISDLGAEALRIMSALTYYWGSPDPTIRQAANLAITQATEITLGPPPPAPPK